MKSYKLKITITLLGLGLAALVLMNLRPNQSKSVTQNKTNSSGLDVVGRVMHTKNESKGNEPIASEGNKSVVFESLNKMSEPRQALAALIQYKSLKSKVFRSENEEMNRIKIINNGLLIQGLGQLLLTPEVSSDESAAAIDLLLESYQSGNRDSSWQAILQVIADKQIENESTPLSLREAIAGNKGELMYHISAIAPDASAIIEKHLPGPISTKIWQNVIIKQNENYEISYQEKLAHEAGR